MLAGHLGRTVREIEETVDAMELREWEDFFAMQKKGDDGGDDGLGLAKAIAIPKA